MKPFLTINSQRILSLVLSLVFASLVNLSAVTLSPPISQTWVTPGLYETISNGWSIDLVVYPSAVPKIVSVKPVDETRLSEEVDSEYHIQLLDENQGILYDHGFNVSFYFGEPPVKREKITLNIVMPRIPGEAIIRVITPNGEINYDLSR